MWQCWLGLLGQDASGHPGRSSHPPALGLRSDYRQLEAGGGGLSCLLVQTWGQPHDRHMAGGTQQILNRGENE